MKQFLIPFILLVFISCNSNKILKEFKKENSKIDKIQISKDPFLNLDCTVMSFEKSESKYFETKYIPKIYIFERTVKSDEIKEVLKLNHEFLSYSKFIEETVKNQSEESLIYRNNKIDYNLLLNTRIVDGTKVSILFFTIMGDSLNHRDDYYKIINQLK
tara:strand:- start:244 stop:720 length:477 start_codon:yes stop_codon:yes gene_type:complete